MSIRKMLIDIVMVSLKHRNIKPAKHDLVLFEFFLKPASKIPPPILIKRVDHYFINNDLVFLNITLIFPNAFGRRLRKCRNTPEFIDERFLDIFKEYFRKFLSRIIVQWKQELNKFH